MGTLSSRQPTDVNFLSQKVEDLEDELEIMTGFATLLGAVVNVCARAEMMSENGAPTSELKSMHVELGMMLSTVLALVTIDPSYLIVLLEANINRIEEMLP